MGDPSVGSLADSQSAGRVELCVVVRGQEPYAFAHLLCLLKPLLFLGKKRSLITASHAASEDAGRLNHSVL